MRLLNTTTKRLESFYGNDVPGYAILSHTWGQEKDEVLFKHITGSNDDRREGKQRKGYAKLVAACKQAIKDGWEYIWIDTCCIDKESSAELSEAINSMYGWYWQSGVCYAYLEDVHGVSAWGNGCVPFEHSKWFKRGWTLQELIAPARVVFYSRDWIDIGTKATLRNIISNVTRIRVEMITGYDPKRASVAERMSWAAFRQTTRDEDGAYCLMGLFGVHMPLLYGEGKRAFMRLQEEIMKTSDDHSLFAWKGNYDSDMYKTRGLLADSPWNFRDAGNVVQDDDERAYPPYSMTNKGLQIQLPLQPIGPREDAINISSTASGCRKVYKAILKCTIRNKDPTLSRRIVIYLAMVEEGYYVRIFPHWLDDTQANPNEWELTPLFVTQVGTSTSNRDLRGGFKIKILPTDSGFTFGGNSLMEGYDLEINNYRGFETLVFNYKKGRYGVVIGSDNGVPWLDVTDLINKGNALGIGLSYNKRGSRQDAKARYLDRLSVNISNEWSVVVSAKWIRDIKDDRYYHYLLDVIIDFRRSPIQVEGIQKRHIPALVPSGGNSGNYLLGHLDPHIVHPDFKKEGSDWFAVFNPRVKRVLDISLIHSFKYESEVHCVQFSSDGRYLATGCDQTAQIYDMGTGDKICVFPHEPTARATYLHVLSLCFSSDNKFLAMGMNDNSIKIWDITKKCVRNVINGHQGTISFLKSSSDGWLIASRYNDGLDGVLKVLPIDNFNSISSDSKSDSYYLKNTTVKSIAISPNGKFIAAGSTDGAIRIWDIRTTQLVEQLQGHQDAVLSVIFMPDGKSLVSGGSDMVLKYWDISGLIVSDTERGVEGPNHEVGAPGTLIQKGVGKSSQCMMNLTGHKDYVLSVSVSHNGHWVASGSGDGSVQFWDSRDGTAQFILQVYNSMVFSVGMSPMGNIFTTCGRDQQVRIWKYSAV